MLCVDPEQTHKRATNLDPNHKLIYLEMICIDSDQSQWRATSVDPDQLYNRAVWSVFTLLTSWLTITL